MLYHQVNLSTFTVERRFWRLYVGPLVSQLVDRGLSGALFLESGARARRLEGALEPLPHLNRSPEL